MHPGHGVYVHIPFCAKKCDYCAFATFTDRHQLTSNYLEALRIDIRRSVATAMPPATSVFIGGGTPTLVPANELMSVLGEIKLATGAEVTVECNPDDVTLAMMRTYRGSGVNRVSVGVQSTVGHVLASLGRTHNPENVQRAVSAVHQAGFKTFNLDIIYGAAGESLDDWRKTVNDVVALDPPHVSAYGLTVEANTALASQPDRHPDDDDQADKYEIVDELFNQSGLLNYEISNWAKPGHECEHNSLYWQQGNYHGFGSAAHAHLDGRRWWNVRTPERYIELVMAGESPESSSETLDAQTRKREALQLLVRTRDGVPFGSISQFDLEEMSELVEQRDNKLVLTRAGRLMANEVALRLIDS
ncbi:MAG: radical SAM family heme chaperone HemW [Acidimicrobiaceae bacterium]|nr:radical SAM family heme chaperone HemW [Acidimicrobiaceae bacterium]